MLRPVLPLLLSLLSVAGSYVVAYAYDPRIDPKAASRDEISFTPSLDITRTLDAGEDNARLPAEYTSAMTWYRVALADGYTQAPLVHSPWLRDEQLPEPLHWAWIADDGDLIIRAGKGLYRLSSMSNQNTWFRDVDCRLETWPEGNSEAVMVCNDGNKRTMQIPGGGVVLVDDVQYVRAFDSKETTLPPQETLPDEKLTAAEQAAVAANGPVSILQPETVGSQAEQSDSQPAASNLPAEAPVPLPR